MDLRAVGEDFGEAVGDGHALEAEAEIARYGYAVFAYHCYAGAAVYSSPMGQFAGRRKGGRENRSLGLVEWDFVLMLKGDDWFAC